MVVQEIAPGVFVAAGLYGANVGLIRTQAGAVLIDTPWVPEQARAWRAEVERLSPEGVAYLIQTDYHLDHILGACLLPPALTIAHDSGWKQLKGLEAEALRERVLEMGQEQIPDLAAQLADIHILSPQITCGPSMTLWVGEERIDILHFGGHTAATLGVYLPAQRVLFSGDLIVTGAHPHAGDCSCRQWLQSLEQVRAMDIRIIVPGHGQPGGPEIIEPVYSYLRELYCRVEECFRTGHTRRETVERVKPLDAFPVASGREEQLRRLLRSSVERVYDEIKKESTRSRPRSS